jgi:hypothetical protein
VSATTKLEALGLGALASSPVSRGQVDGRPNFVVSDTVTSLAQPCSRRVALAAKRCYCQNVGYRRTISRFLSAGRWCLGCGLTGRRPAADLALAAGFPSQPRLSAPKKRNGRRVARRPLRFGRLRNAVLPQSSLEPARIGDDEVGALVSGNASAECPQGTGIRPIQLRRRQQRIRVNATVQWRPSERPPDCSMQRLTRRPCR